MRFCLFLLCCTCVCAAVKVDPKQLIELATTTPDQLRDALAASLSAEQLSKGTALVEYGPDFLWAIEADKRPLLFVDGAQWPAPMREGGGRRTQDLVRDR